MKYMDGWTDGWMDGWVDGWMGGWAGGWIFSDNNFTSSMKKLTIKTNYKASGLWSAAEKQLDGTHSIL
jgi:hypothetical protein